MEITFDNPAVEYTVYVKDTQGNYHILKTSDKTLSSLSFKKTQGDYVIDQVFVQITNNSESQQEGNVSFKIKSNFY